MACLGPTRFLERQTMRKLRLIDVLAFLWQLTRLDDPENAEFGRELLAAVIG